MKDETATLPAKEFLRRREAECHGAAVGGAMRVLIAEDERRTRAMLFEMIASLGCESVVASSGLEAMRIIQEKRPDVLLLDGLLPEMHGFEIARFARSLASEYQPRIVVITAIYKDERLPQTIDCKRGKSGDKHHHGNAERLVPLRDVQ